jgi:acyl CoA:acetate/3-ketoacid CoA transferase alpha subunit
MKKLFDLAAERHEEIAKHAIAGALLSGLGRGTMGVAKTVIKNPVKSGMTGLTALEMGAGASSGARMAAQGKNVGTFLTTPAGNF